MARNRTPEQLERHRREESARRARDLEAAREAVRRSRKKRREATPRQRFPSTPETRREQSNRYRQANVAVVRERTKRWKAANKGRLAALQMKRKAAQLHRTPAWADLDAIAMVYQKAARLTAETGIPHHVDHDIPLQGRLVSGLHVLGNLQILTATANISKHNKFRDMGSVPVAQHDYRVEE
jgi:hypothetical protein